MLDSIDKIFFKRGKILSVRKWNSNNIHELDIYLPNVSFENWTFTQSIKCRTSTFHFTDYTPSIWDANEKTCTLYIDTSHKGLGAIWAKNQEEGNYFQYVKIESEKHYPIPNKQLVLIGDSTAIGHFNALNQLAPKNTRSNGFIVFNNHYTANEFPSNCPWLPLQPFSNYNTLFEKIEERLSKKQFENNDSIFYVVGKVELVVEVRRLLKNYGVLPEQIKLKGFWK